MESNLIRRFVSSCIDGNPGGMNNYIRQGGDVDIIINGCTPLIIASDKGYLSVVETLLEAKADVNCVSKENGTTALLQASQNGHLSVVKKLLESEASVNFINEKNGYTALTQASRNGHVLVVEKLLEAKAYVNAQRHDGVSSLMLASQEGHLSVVKKLLEAKADVKCVSKKGGATALMQAFQEGHVSVVKKILEEKLEVNKQRYDGVTDLMSASLFGNLPQNSSSSPTGVCTDDRTDSNSSGLKCRSR